MKNAAFCEGFTPYYYTVMYLYTAAVSDWLYFLWHGIKLNMQILHFMPWPPTCTCRNCKKLHQSYKLQELKNEHSIANCLSTLKKCDLNKRNYSHVYRARSSGLPIAKMQAKIQVWQAKINLNCQTEIKMACSFIYYSSP